MTQEEYKRLYRQARDSFFNLTVATMKQLSKVYQSAADDAAEIVRNSIKLDRSTLTIESWNNINIQLSSGASRISQAVDTAIKNAVSQGYKNMSDIDKLYILDLVKASGATSITAEGLDRIAVAINESVIVSLVNRIYSDDYTYSDRIWGDFKIGKTGIIPIGINGDYQYRMKNVISAGLAQGRDVVKIAKDLQVYAKDGKVKLVQRYGTLLRGTEEFTKRITGKVDWRALRLVRSELYASMQDAAVQQNLYNPAATGMFEWRLNPGALHDTCICPELAENSPYPANEVPSFPHPSCVCVVVPILENTNDMIQRAKKFANGEYDEKLTTWYNNVYLRYNN